MELPFGLRSKTSSSKALAEILLMRETPDRSWFKKFADAGRGVKLGVHGQASFYVHFFVATLVIVAASVLKVDRADWVGLILCITVVLGAEMFNSALEWLAAAVTREHDERIRNALDISSGAVLVASIGAAAGGAIIFLSAIYRMFFAG